MSSCETMIPRHFALSLFVGNGKNFVNKNWFESKAPYVEITIGDETKKTSKLSGLENPCWNETLKFHVKDNNNLPSSIRFVVKDNRFLVSSVELGDYTLNLEQEKLLNYMNQNEMTPFCTLYDGIINLNNTENSFLTVKIEFMCCDCNWLKQENENLISGLNLNVNEQRNFEEVRQSDFENMPNIASTSMVEENKENKVLEQNEVHVLPTIYVQEKPKIIEKEVEYIKPVEVKQTIVHKEKPIIVEQPIIKEKHEHYREAADYVKNHAEIITENKEQLNNMGNIEQETLKNLKEQKLQEFNDTTPIIEREKQTINLQSEVIEQPTQLREKEVVYHQPIEIEKTNIEKVLPTVREDVTTLKQHSFEKMEPEIISNQPKVVHDNNNELNQQSQAM